LIAVRWDEYVIIFSILVLVLVFVPTGLFGRAPRKVVRNRDRIRTLLPIGAGGGVLAPSFFRAVRGRPRHPLGHSGGRSCSH